MRTLSEPIRAVIPGHLVPFYHDLGERLVVVLAVDEYRYPNLDAQALVALETSGGLPERGLIAVPMSEIKFGTRR